jgi:hypothetical protein
LRAVAVLAMSGCGGGVFISFSDGFDDSAPSVSLAAASTRVPAGRAVQFVAAASDESGIDHVELMRLDGGVPVFAARDAEAPYEFSIAAPADGRDTLVVFARAIDNEGSSADSLPVSVVIGL